MKKLSNLLAALVFVSLVIFISCTSDGGTEPVDPLDTQAALLQNSWTANAAQVSYNSGNPDVTWEGFALTVSNASVSGGSYSTSGTPTGFESVWPGSGSWTFSNTSGSLISRDNSVEISISNLTATTLTMTFNIATGTGRTSGIDGAWSFTFTAP